MVSRQMQPPGQNFKICEEMIFSFAAIYKDYLFIFTISKHKTIVIRIEEL